MRPKVGPRDRRAHAAVSPVTSCAMNVATRPIRQPSVKVRFTLVVVIAVVVLHCAVTLALLVRASRFALASLGATPAAHNQTADLIRTGLLWLALTLLSIAGAALALRRVRVGMRASGGIATHPDEGPPEIVPDSFL